MPYVEAGHAAESRWTLFTWTHKLRAGRALTTPMFDTPFNSLGAANLAAVTLLPPAPNFLVLEIPGWVSVQILDQYEAIWIQAAIQPDADLGVALLMVGFITLRWIWTSSFRGSREPLRIFPLGIPTRRGHNAFCSLTYRHAFFCRAPGFRTPLRREAAVPIPPPPKRRMKKKERRRTAIR